jgi:micrococcal nuclease
MPQLNHNSIAYTTQRALDSPTPPPCPSTYRSGFICSVADGDGGRLLVDDDPYLFRLLGLDAPELFDCSRLGTPIGQFARMFLRDLVVGERVRIMIDAHQPERDKYGRLLLWVWLDRSGLFVNGAVLEAGQARFRPDFQCSYYDYCRQAEGWARFLRRGMWFVP